jgi:hypothetical protein
MKSTFKILHFNDYHCIKSCTYKTIELGCFPAKNHAYFRYFGLFYKGRKPSFDKVFNNIKKKIDMNRRNEYVDYTGNLGLKILKSEIKEALNYKNV